jgi:hypothetical protein
MKVLFLDFDGVLNSAASFGYERRFRDRHPELVLGPVNETLCNVCTANFQVILDHFPQLKVVISSTWRELFDLDWLRHKLASYGIDSSRVIDRTPSSFSRYRGAEINAWLKEHPEVTRYVVIDDNEIGDGIPDENIVKTSWNVGLTLPHALEAIEKLGGRKNKHELYME